MAATLVLALLAATLHVRPAASNLTGDHGEVASLSGDCSGNAVSLDTANSHCATPSLCWSLPGEHASTNGPRAVSRPRPAHAVEMPDALFVSPPAMPPRAVA
ncbi:hypothetical protein [Lutibaculum baratangense]|uniref:hypothetical protein n=1 Tax=Lutibaculum baratangense TaxID=1358440 RepID=UPI001269491F|nr:hypothetical protein [Lutibaculum baratangense]